ncbi:MAG: PilN domain-containing protein [Gammaproteobacteria bacterium]|nr:PilN domain-containing protein [Gammaproteobacteria bacterium]
MASIDLIPVEYRQRLDRIKWLRLLGMSVSILALVEFAAHAGISYQISGLKRDIKDLQRKQAITAQQRTELNDLQQKRDDYQQQLDLLKGLRGGTEAAHMLVSVDKALQGNDVWFDQWEFQRSGEAVKENEKAVNTGYFVVIPKQGNQASQEGWLINSHMTIRGQARDHAALSEFVRRLIDQQAISEVRIVRTEQRKFRSMAVVDFDLAVVVGQDKS